MKIVLGGILVLALVFPIALNAEGEKKNIDFYLNGGMGYMLNGGGDIGLERSDAKYWWQNGYSGAPNARWNDGIRNLNGHLTLGAIWQAGRNWGIGLSSGFIRGASNYSYAGELPDQAVDSTLRNSISAIPIQLELYKYLALRLDGRMTLVMHMGLGYYFSRWTRTSHLVSSDEYYFYAGPETIPPADAPLETRKDFLDFQRTETFNSGAVGIVGGIGLETRINSFLSLGCEVAGRNVNLRNWHGSSNFYGDQKTYVEVGDGSWNLISDSTHAFQVDGHSWTIVGDRDSFARTEFLIINGGSEQSDRIRKSRLNLNSLGLAFSLRIRI